MSFLPMAILCESGSRLWAHGAPRAKSQEPRAKSQVRISSYPGPSTVRASGMRVEKTERVRRRLLEAAVADNLETIRGLPPRPLRTGRRLWAIWLRRTPLLLIPITLAASTYIAANSQRSNSAPLGGSVVRASVAPVSAEQEPLVV